MPKAPKPDTLEQLRTLNEFLARTRGSDPEGAEHARRVLDFFAVEARDAMDQLSLEACAQKLANMHLGEEALRQVAFAHWHVPGASHCSPLWIRQAIVTEMKQLAGRRQALLLVTGLREAICPVGAYWTRAREAQYRRVRDWIDELVCAWATRGSQLQVIVL
ncbi:MAG: hypothetical protein ACPGKS_01810 [Coraliomargarita sp.]